MPGGNLQRYKNKISILFAFKLHTEKLLREGVILLHVGF